MEYHEKQWKPLSVNKKRLIFYRHIQAFIIFLSFAVILLFIQQVYGKEQIHSKPIKLRVLSYPYLSLAPFFIADEEGFFTEQGIQIEFIKMSDTTAALPALIKGDLDVWAGFINPGCLNAIARGTNIRMVADKGQLTSGTCAYVALLARRGLIEEKKLNKPSQLKGQRFAINRDSAVTGFFLDKIIDHAHLTMDDVQIVLLPPEVRLEAFGKGSIDVTLVSEPWVTRILQSGHAVEWIPIQQIIPDFQYSVILIGPNILEKNTEAGKLFMVAYLKAVRQINHGKTERNLKILVKHTGLDQEFLKKVCWPFLQNDGKINIESVLDFQAWAVKRGFLDKVVPTNQFWDPSFVEYANKVLSSSTK